MKRKALGRTGLEVSEICFGTMSFGGDADEAEARRLYAACRDAGIDFFDCANVYSGGEAERILGRLIAHERDELVVTSKCAMPAAGKNAGANRRHIVGSAEASLRRLKVERIDLFFIHRWDPTVPVIETLRSLEDLRRAGKIAHAGVSNWAAWQIEKALGIAAREGWAPIEAIQPMYNLVKRQAEVEILPMAAEEGLGVISYGPNAGGLLTGKYAAGAGAGAGAGARLSVNDHYRQRYDHAGQQRTAAEFAELAKARGVDPVTLAVAWAGAHPAITCPIVGARSAEQLSASLAAPAFELTPELYADVAALSPTPPPATDRLEEQAHGAG